MILSLLHFPVIRREALVQSALALAFALMIGVGAHVRVTLPFTPVPVTFQTLFLLIGASYLRRSFSLQMVGWYLLLGAMGLPLFASSSSNGWILLSGPTGGYLFGFILSAWVLGYLQGRSAWQQLLLYVAAHTVLFVPGLLWLRWTMHLDWPRTIVMGFTPFIVGDILKSSIAFSTWFFFPKHRGFE